MLTQLIDHNEDIRKLKEEGYNIEVVNAHLVISEIPYVNKDKEIKFGKIFCPMVMSGEKVSPNDHTVYFMGEWPCNQFGAEDKIFVNSPNNSQKLSDDICSNYYFSSKPITGPYKDFYEKMTRYIELLSAPAISLEPCISAKNFDTKSYKEDKEKGVFKYLDTYSALAGITAISDKIKNQKIAIIGLGGTGSYLLDFITKTPVEKISIFDGDEIENHNAFRMPGTISFEELKNRPNKAIFFKEKYETLRNAIEAHDIFVAEDNLDLLKGHDFIFIAIDNSKAKKCIVDFLIEEKIPFVDLGMGVNILNGTIRGSIRKTLVTPDNQSHVDKIDMVSNTKEDIYGSNIQISELNALNAIMGILTWKTHIGFYTGETSHHMVFSIEDKEFINV